MYKVLCLERIFRSWREMKAHARRYPEVCATLEYRELRSQYRRAKAQVAAINRRFGSKLRRWGYRAV